MDISEILKKNSRRILQEWMDLQLKSINFRSDLILEKELQQESEAFLRLLQSAVTDGIPEDLDSPRCAELLDWLAKLSQSRVLSGFNAAEVAMFVFSLKQPIFSQIMGALADKPAEVNTATWTLSTFLDKLGLYTVDRYQKSREDIIRRQQAELTELSTPVVEIWEGVLALPLIGTLDSARTQIVMENLLERLVETGAQIAIIDITGVPTVDTSVAKHLIKTITAARLMGADCLVSGISPAIAQTMVHLGVELAEVQTKASLADALAVAFKHLGLHLRKSQAL